MATAAQADDSGLRDFLLGNYILIGKAVDSDATYQGKVELYAEKNGGMKAKRMIQGQTVIGDAALETALGGEAQVLRIRFSEKNIAYEETCLWKSDLDNYARISCYLYRPGGATANPGLEALFHYHAAQ